MTPRPAIAWTLALVLGVPPLALAASWHTSSSSRAATSERAATRLIEATTSITTLEATLPRSASGDDASEAPSLAQRLTAVVARVGLPQTVVSSASVQDEPGTNASGTMRVLRRRGSVVLTALTLPQLGAFLSAWRTSEPSWSITAIDVAPGGTTNVAPGGDIPVRAVLTVESLAVVAAKPIAQPANSTSLGVGSTPAAAKPATTTSSSSGKPNAQRPLIP